MARAVSSCNAFAIATFSSFFIRIYFILLTDTVLTHCDVEKSYSFGGKLKCSSAAAIHTYTVSQKTSSIFLVITRESIVRFSQYLVTILLRK